MLINIIIINIIILMIYFQEKFSKKDQIYFKIKISILKLKKK